MSTIKLREVNAIGATEKEFECEPSSLIGKIPERIIDSITVNPDENCDVLYIADSNGQLKIANDEKYLNNAKKLAKGDMVFIKFYTTIYGKFSTCIGFVSDKEDNGNIDITISIIGTMRIIDTEEAPETISHIYVTDNYSMFGLNDLDAAYGVLAGSSVNIYKL